ncbi:MAG: ribonuclease Y, partial [Lachnospiraceae bacterium]|nr:ribonuclease Y [Lachnospiraceae bacterium]
MPPIAIAVICVIVALAVAIPVTVKVAKSNALKEMETKVGNADEKARNIIDEAIKTAEAKKR